jgi:hypothetical protein
MYFMFVPQDIPINDMDEAGYEVIKPTKRKHKPPKKPPKGALAMGRSSSAEHLCDPESNIVDVQASKSTNNSPLVRRHSPVNAREDGGVKEDKGAQGADRGAEEPSPVPNEGGDIQDHMYAQVVKKRKKPKKAASLEKPAGEEGVGGSDAREEGESSSGRGSGQDLGEEKAEQNVAGIPSEDIQHENAGSDLYAVVNTKKDKKGKAKNSEAAPTSSIVDALDVDKVDSATPQSGNVPPVKPPKPIPFSSRTGTTPPTSPGVDSGVSISSQGSTGVAMDRARSPVRPAPPVPRGAKVAPSQDSLPPPGSMRTRVASINSRPPAFPPPPPPTPTSPPPNPPVDPDEADSTYAVVDQNFTKRSKNRKQSSTDQLVRVESSTKPSNTVPRVPHTYTTVENSGVGNGLISRVEAVPVKTHSYAPVNGRRRSTKKQKLRSHPSLPPRHTPPPPPPPTTSSTQAAPGSEVRTNPGGTPEFLFSSNYASTLIKVSKPIHSLALWDLILFLGGTALAGKPFKGSEFCFTSPQW